jgi:anti-sigma regulatory factor (Ser/Thr protein kinase)
VEISVEQLVAQPHPGPLDVGRARQALAARLRQWGVIGDGAEVAILLTSELVTNAVRHSCGPIEVQARFCSARVLRVEVCDTGHAPIAAATPAVDDVGGRGLYLVDALADAWGTEHHGTGKRVWFELSHLDLV